jgi:hypothetical protein
MKYPIQKLFIFIAASGGSLVFADFAFAKAASQNECKSNLGSFVPLYNVNGPKKISTRCAKGTTDPVKKSCESTLKLVEEGFNNYNRMIEAGCAKITEEVGKVVEDPENKTQFDASIKQNERQISGYNEINKQTDTIINALITKSETNILALKKFPAKPKSEDQKLIKSLESSHKKGKEDANSVKGFKLTAGDIEKDPRKFDSNVSGDAMPATQALELVKALVSSKDQYAALIQTQEGLLAENQRRKALLDQTDNNTPNSPSSGISGFDPSSLLALAPLAAMLAQKPPATPKEDPMGSNITRPTPPERAPAASLVKGEKNGESKKAPLDIPKNSAPEITPSPYADAFTGAADTSDITKSLKGSGSGGGGANAVSGAGGGGAGGSSSLDGADAKGKSTAALPVNAEEALQSFSSGGGLNYAGGGSSTGTSEAAADPMADMINDMESTVENGFDSNLEGNPSEQGSEIAAEDSDSLFPRVRACHVRALKKGMVLNGLGEKLSELDE